MSGAGEPRGGLVRVGLGKLWVPDQPCCTGRLTQVEKGHRAPEKGVKNRMEAFQVEGT